ncbi:hypothetical protein QBC33DRAFT_534501 [Phialemonium atrogriseum]|uniref:Beta-xylosidase n=1 Tax=Phialemonium atrogriseum TaxID=1093897 RepID=A0AAJ0C434_9PEZI|nr:uncharacterized protein QBC33DRAFT_534501 [Phialemonium atrogriseum]KAK1768307.1 hypothetical protein QBC33DRAFT_534501 [Phialemonium atrogriseum]
MALPLAPLVQLTTGRVHADFPATLLAFWLLTDGQLEALAHFYHQRTPCAWSGHYPCPVPWRSDVPLGAKRRRFGRFIGLRGCESPAAGGCGGAVARLGYGSEEEFVEAARRARESEDEMEMFRRKMGWY